MDARNTEIEQKLTEETKYLISVSSVLTCSELSSFALITVFWLSGFALSFRFLDPYHLVPSFLPAAVADILGEGDEVMMGPVASSFLTKKALMFLNSAARELSGRTLAPEASTPIVRRRVPDLSVSKAVPTE